MGTASETPQERVARLRAERKRLKEALPTARKWAWENNNFGQIAVMQARLRKIELLLFWLPDSD